MVPVSMMVELPWGSPMGATVVQRAKGWRSADWMSISTEPSGRKAKLDGLWIATSSCTLSGRESAEQSTPATLPGGGGSGSTPLLSPPAASSRRAGCGGCAPGAQPGGGGPSVKEKLLKTTCRPSAPRIETRFDRRSIRTVKTVSSKAPSSGVPASMAGRGSAMLTWPESSSCRAGWCSILSARRRKAASSHTKMRPPNVTGCRPPCPRGSAASGRSAANARPSCTTSSCGAVSTGTTGSQRGM
mmetsp:Transcript_1669/g.4514  ORF Transcript_1669/g.4514 Transcript_1669/m.4514 type:complete len:244 (+) Transcript_1669:881-1612(+)